MKNIVAMAALVAVLVPSAYAVGEQRDPRVPRLQAQVRTLQAQMRAVTGRVTEVEGFAQCIRSTPAVPVSVYGTDQGDQGYIYTIVSQNAAFVTTALDVTAQGEQVGSWLAAVNPTCLQQRNLNARAVSRKASPPSASAAWRSQGLPGKKQLAPSPSWFNG
jgi:hypothetical protein